MNGANVAVTVDPTARIQGLLEANDRMLARARAAEAKLAAGESQAGVNLVILSAMKDLIEGMADILEGRASLAGSDLEVMRVAVAELADSLRHIPSPSELH